MMTRKQKMLLERKWLWADLTTASGWGWVKRFCSWRYTKVELKDTVLELALKLKKHLESSIKLEGMLIGFCKEDIKT